MLQDGIAARIQPRLQMKPPRRDKAQHHERHACRRVCDDLRVSVNRTSEGSLLQKGGVALEMVEDAKVYNELHHAAPRHPMPRFSPSDGPLGADAIRRRR